MWNSSVPPRAKSVFLTLLLLLGIFLSIVPRANAADTGMWVINPSTGAPPTGNGNFTFYVDQTTPVGTRFNVTIWVSDVANLFAWQIRLYYFPKLLNFTKATYPEDNVFAGKGTFKSDPAVTTQPFANQSEINMTNPLYTILKDSKQTSYTLTDWFDVDKNGELSVSDVVWLQATGKAAEYFRVASFYFEDPRAPEYGITVQYPFVEFAHTLLNVNDAFGGTGKLAAFEFQLQTAPQKLATLSSVLGINNAETQLLDTSDPQQVISPVIKEDGLVQYAWPLPATKPNVSVRRVDGEAWPLEFGSTPSPTGKAFDVNLAIENLDAEWGLIEANMTIAFNATVIDIVGGLGNITILSQWNPTKLEINYNAYPELDNLTINVRPSSMSTPSGNLLVATVKITLVYAGPWGVDVSSPINFVENVLVDDPGPALIPQNPPVNGTVIIKGLTVEVRFLGSLERNEYIASKNGTFDVEVWLNDVTADKRLANAQFRLKYNSSLLRVLSITEGTFLKSFPNIAPPNNPTFFISYDEPDGLYGPHVLVGISLLPSQSEPSYYNFPNGSGPLAKITFEGIYRGFYPEKNNCSLELVDVVLLDDKYPFNSILASPIDGYYEIVSYATPVAAFTTRSSISGALHLNVTIPVVFDASDSTHPLNLPIVSYAWNFGDGNETITALKVTSHVFMIPGDYIVDLTVTDDDGKTMTTTKSIAVWKLSSTISLDISPLSATFGQTVTVEGTVAREVSPLDASVDVNLFYRLQGEENWQAVATISTDAAGHFSYTWEPSKRTSDIIDRFELNASWTGDSITSSAQNRRALELKMARSIINLNANPSSLIVGSTVKLSGVITPSQKGGVSVTILHRTMGGIWTPYATVNTNEQGNFESAWQAQGTGIFEARAIYVGNENAGQAQSSIVALIVTKSTSLLEVHVYPSKVIVGSNISVYGKIDPKKQSINVTISYENLDGLWKTLAEVTTDSDGRYSTSLAIDEIGTFQIKARWEGDSSSLPSEDSEEITVEAQPMNILLYILIAILIVTVTVAMMVYYRRRKKRELNSFV